MRRATWMLCAMLVALPATALAQNAATTRDAIQRMADDGELEAAAGLAQAAAAERPLDVDAQVLHQDLALRQGDARGLLKSFKARAQREGASADDLYLYARLLSDRAALAEHRRTLRLDDDHIRTLLALADLHLARDELRDAGDALARAVETAPELAAPRLGLAEVHRRNGDTESAEAVLRDAITHEPRCVQAHVELGVLLAESARYGDARMTLEAAAEIDSEDPLPHLAMSHLERMLGRDRDALEAFEERRQAEIDAARGAAEEAARIADEAGEEPPEVSPPPPLGTASQRAAAACRIATELAPRSFVAQVLLAHAASAAGDGLTARGALFAAAARNPMAPETGTFRARLDLDEGLVAEAKASADTVLSVHRDLPVALYLRGVAQSRLGGARKAQKDLEKAIRESDDNPLYLRGLAALHAANGRWRDAIRTFQKVVRATDAAPRSVYELALAQRRAGKAKDAASSLEALVADAPQDRDAWLLLGRVYGEDLRKQEQRAIECLLRYQELGGEHADVDDWIDALQNR